MATIYKDIGHLQYDNKDNNKNNNKDNNKDSPITPPGRIASHLAPETAPRSKDFEDSHRSHFSSSDLIEAFLFQWQTNVFFSLSFEQATFSNDL